jgi:thiosulfate/3-mercaptopyruvate sulfurtransferase
MLLLPGAGAATAAPAMVETDWLAARLADPALVIVDMSDDTQYQRFHIPGARLLPYRVLNTSRKKGVSISIDDQQLVHLLGKLGIARSTHVIIYDDLAGLNASRLFWMLERIGHENVSLLNGGLVKWILEGRKVTAQIPRVAPVSYTSGGKGRNNLAAMQDVAPDSRAANSVVLDVRSKEEYAGNPRQKRSGHVPGARWWPWESAVDFGAAFTQRDDASLRAQLASLGLEKTDTPVVLYCRTGHRASQTYFTLRKLGYSSVRIYDGSMAEYGQHRQAPLSRGMQP